jgi:hypothetical protein
VGVGEADALCGESVECWGGHVFCAGAGEVGVPDVIGEDEEDVGFYGEFSAVGVGAGEGEDGREE